MLELTLLIGVQLLEFGATKNHIFTLDVGALGFSISGAGPSMFAMCDNSIKAEAVIEAAVKLYGSKKLAINTYLSKINHEGAIRY